MVAQKAIRDADTRSATARRGSCVIDPRLAMCDWGLYAVTHLATAFEPWISGLAREVLLSADARSVEHTQFLIPKTQAYVGRRMDPERENARIRMGLQAWLTHAQGKPDDLSGPVLYHFGDTVAESSLPNARAGDGHARFLALDQMLDTRVQSSGYDLERGWGLWEWYRQTIALGGALGPSRPVVFTRLEPDGLGQPAICDYAQAWHLRVRHVDDQGGQHSAWLRRKLDEADLGPVAWAGIRLAALHVVLEHPSGHAWADNVVPMTPAQGPVVLGNDPWADAYLFWHEVW